MILSTDIVNNFENVMTFRSRLATKKFPEDNRADDKQLIMNIVLYASDHAAPCKGSISYFRWMANEMEEYY
jgi:hypothetical protein